MTTAPVGQSYPAQPDQVQANGPGHVQGGDGQRFSPGSAPSRTGKGSASGPHTAPLPSVAQAKRKPAPGYSEVIAALGDVPLAAAAYLKAIKKFDDASNKLGDTISNANEPGHKLNETELKDLKDLEGLKAERDAALTKSAHAKAKLIAAVRTTINKSSCTTHGKCNFSSAQEAAAKLDEAVRKDSSKLQAEGKITKDEANDRQVTLRTATNEVLTDFAYDSLRSLIDGRANAQERGEIVNDVVSWVAKDEGYPAATTRFGHLKPIIISLKAYSRIDGKNQGNVTALINDLLAKCEKQGMEITKEQKKEIGVP